MVAFELFAIAHNLNAELSTLGITSKEAENDSSLYDHLIVNESLREKLANCILMAITPE